MDMNGVALEQSSPDRGPAAGSKRILLDELSEVGRDVVRGGQPLQLSIEPVDDSTVGATEPRCVLDERFQDGLEVERGAADDLQDFAGGGLLLQRVGQGLVPGLELLEQAHVLDGNDRLVGEGLEQADLPLGEGPYLGAAEADRAD